MKYFSLKTAFKDQQGLTPNVYLNLGTEETLRLKETLTNFSFYESADSIPFLLDEAEGYPSRVLDINMWIKSEPEAFKMVISPKFKEILEGFYLPEHRFYESYVYIASEKQKAPLYVFHFHFDYIKEIILEETTFEERRSIAKGILNRVLAKGEIKTAADFKLYIEEKRTNRYWFYPDKLRFKPGVYYDVFATEDGIIVSERVKQAIEQADLTGVELSKYTDYEITMGKNSI